MVDEIDKFIAEMIKETEHALEGARENARVWAQIVRDLEDELERWKQDLTGGE